MNKLKKYPKIWLLRGKMSLMASLEYRTSVFFYFLASMTWSLASLFVRNMIYHVINNIRGWTFDEMTLLISIYNYSFAFLLIFSWNSVYHHFRPAVKDGKLDIHLTRPISARFMLTTCELDINGILHLIPSTIILIFALNLHTLQFNFLNVFLFLIYFFIGQYMIYSILYLFYAITFMITSAEQISSFFWTLQDMTKQPLEIFPKKLQYLFLTLIPLGFIAYIPTKALLGQLPDYFIIYAICFTIFLVILNKFIWKVGLKKYESVGS